MQRSLVLGVVLLLSGLVSCAGCRSAQTVPGAERVRERPSGHVHRGVASWYGPKFHGRLTANGETYDMHGLTAAHRTLPFGTWVRVTHLGNGRSVDLRINDRGPFVKGRMIDVSYAAAQRLDLVGSGTARVEIRVLDGPRREESVSEASSSGPRVRQRYTVQLGAFQEPERARRLRAEVARSHPEATVRTDGLWHRVQVGSFATRDAAERLLMELTRRGYTALVMVLP